MCYHGSGQGVCPEGSIKAQSHHLRRLGEISVATYFVRISDPKVHYSILL